MVIYLEKKMERLIFGRLKEYLRNNFVHSQQWSDEKWKSTMARGEGNKKRFQYCTDPSGQELLHLRALQGLSWRNLFDPSLQDNVLIPDNFFEYIYQIRCTINLHSITNSGLIPGGQNLSKGKQTVFFTAVNPMNKEHKDPNEIDLNAPRLAWYKKKVEKTSKHVVLGRHNLALKKGLKFDQTRSNAIILHETLPAYCIPKVVMMETGEIIYGICVTSPSSKDFLLMIRFRSCWKVVKTSSKPNQKPKIQQKERRDPWVSNHLVCLLRRSEKMSCLVAKAQTQERGDLWMVLHSARVVCQM